MNMRRVKDTKDKEPLVVDILLIKQLDYFILFDYGKEFFNNLEVTYEKLCMENAKDKYWAEVYDTVTNYNDWNNALLSNVNIK